MLALLLAASGLPLDDTALPSWPDLPAVVYGTSDTVHRNPDCEHLTAPAAPSSVPLGNSTACPACLAATLDELATHPAAEELRHAAAILDQALRAEFWIPASVGRSDHPAGFADALHDPDAVESVRAYLRRSNVEAVDLLDQLSLGVSAGRAALNELDALPGWLANPWRARAQAATRELSRHLDRLVEVIGDDILVETSQRALRTTAPVLGRGWCFLAGDADYLAGKEVTFGLLGADLVVSTPDRTRIAANLPVAYAAAWLGSYALEVIADDLPATLERRHPHGGPTPVHLASGDALTDLVDPTDEELAVALTLWQPATSVPRAAGGSAAVDGDFSQRPLNAALALRAARGIVATSDD